MQYYNNLLECINNLDNESAIEKNIENLIEICTNVSNCEEYIIEIIENNSKNKVTLLNYISIKLYESGIYDSVVPLLNKALEIYPNDKDSLFNLSAIMYRIGENKLSLNYLNKIINKDFECNNLTNKILILENKPILSICIPTYNRAERLNKCLSSIFSQIGNDMQYEIIVSDNCSDDNTKEIVSSYNSEFNNILYFRNEVNVGGEKNFLLSARKANGKYIFLHGDDDYFKNDSLNMILNSIKNNDDSGVVFLDVRKKDNNVNLIYGLDDFIKYISIYSTFVSSIIMKREEFYKIDNLEKKIGSYIPQLYWICNILERNPKCLIINNDVYYHEEDNAPGGYTYSFAEVMIKNYFTILEEFVGRGLNKDTIEKEKDNLVRRSLWYFEYGLKRKDAVYIRNFEEIFYEFYKDKKYFQQVWKELLIIKGRN